MSSLTCMSSMSHVCHHYYLYSIVTNMSSLTPVHHQCHPYIMTCHCVSVDSVKQSVQAMEICRRPNLTMFDGLNRPSAGLMASYLPSTSANITFTFNNHINSLTNQVRVVTVQFLLHDSGCVVSL